MLDKLSKAIIMSSKTQLPLLGKRLSRSPENGLRISISLIPFEMTEYKRNNERRDHEVTPKVASSPTVDKLRSGINNFVTNLLYSVGLRTAADVYETADVNFELMQRKDLALRQAVAKLIETALGGQDLIEGTTKNSDGNDYPISIEHFHGEDEKKSGIFIIKNDRGLFFFSLLDGTEPPFRKLPSSPEDAVQMILNFEANTI